MQGRQDALPIKSSFIPISRYFSFLLIHSTDNPVFCNLLLSDFQPRVKPGQAEDQRKAVVLMSKDLRMGWEQKGLWDFFPWDGEGAEIPFSTQR